MGEWERGDGGNRQSAMHGEGERLALFLASWVPHNHLAAPLRLSVRTATRTGRAPGVDIVGTGLYHSGCGGTKALAFGGRHWD